MWEWNYQVSGANMHRGSVCASLASYLTLGETGKSNASKVTFATAGSETAEGQA